MVTGVIDHDSVQKSFLMDQRQALPAAERLYCRAELQRQTLQKDGSWSGWSLLDMDAILGLLDNVPAIEEERVAPKYLVGSLVDPLPFLTIGSWRGVDVEEFLAAEKEGLQDRPPSNENPPGPVDMRGMMSPARGDRDGGPPRRALPIGPQRDRPPVLMVRSFDFTVEPGRTYRYRARVVLFNPHFDRADARDRNKWIFGPWSGGTEIVTVPAR